MRGKYLVVNLVELVNSSTDFILDVLLSVRKLKQTSRNDDASIERCCQLFFMPVASVIQ